MKKVMMFITSFVVVLFVMICQTQTKSTDNVLPKEQYLIINQHKVSEQINLLSDYINKTSKYYSKIIKKQKNKKIAKKVSNENPYEGYITKYMDLENRMDITQDDIEKVINYYTKEYPDSELKGQAKAYIKASNKTGLDPVFLLALSGHEAGWYVSDLHANRNNPYSIGMWDEDPYNGMYLGDTFSEGIVNGAKWIRKNYYNEGETCLYDMIYGGKEYSSTQDEWINNIVTIMDDSYKIINKGEKL